MLLLVLALLVATPTAAPDLTDAEQEHFLRTARVVKAVPIGSGITGSLRATLTDGTLTHDAQIQFVDEFKGIFRTKEGTELNFHDSWRYNVAAYVLDRMLGLHLVPVTVERNWQAMPAAYTWWVDDVMMDERERLAKQKVAPNYACWLRQSQALRLFDRLIQNTDRNLGNTLITKSWRVWAIDHTRTFRHSPKLSGTADLTSIEADVLERLASLDLKSLKAAIGRNVDDADIRSLLSRRDALVAHYRSLGAEAIVTTKPCAG